MLEYTDFFPKGKNFTVISDLGEDTGYVWEILPKIQPFLEKKLQNKQIINGNILDGANISNKPLFLDEGTIVEPGAYIEGPAYIGKNVTIRSGAYVRTNSILLDNSILGNSSEIKNSIMSPWAHAPHFNYVGDSILGYKVNLGAGTKLSNLAVSSIKDENGTRPTIKIKIEKREYDTGLTKLGAILGDNVQTGCNSVLNPGCLVRENTLVYANVSLKKGYYPPGHIIKLHQQLEMVKKR